jgi:hypothetical protein
MWVDGNQLPLNHMMQETIGNVMPGFSKTLKGMDESPEKIEVKIKKLPRPWTWTPTRIHKKRLKL